MFWFTVTDCAPPCKLCKAADTTSDIVRVAVPVYAGNSETDEVSELSSGQRTPVWGRSDVVGAFEAPLKAAGAESEANHVAERRKTEEHRRRQQEEDEQQKRQHVKFLAQKEVEKQRLREERAREKQAKKDRAREEKRLEQVKATHRRQVEEFLAAKGFSGINAKRSKMFRYKYPLHSAVKLNDVTMVKLLLEAGGDFTLTNSYGETPMQLAQSYNEHGGYAGVVRALRAGRTYL